MHTRKREQLLLKDAKPHPDISLLQKNLKPLGKSRKTYCEFHTLHLGERWKITSLLETGRKPSCVPLIRHHPPLVKCQDLWKKSSPWGQCVVCYGDSNGLLLLLADDRAMWVLCLGPGNGIPVSTYPCWVWDRVIVERIAMARTPESCWCCNCTISWWKHSVGSVLYRVFRRKLIIGNRSFPTIRLIWEPKFQMPLYDMYNFASINYYLSQNHYSHYIMEFILFPQTFAT